MVNSTFTSNSASFGGGICIDNGNQQPSLTNSTITLTNCTISSNTSQDEGGGIYNHGPLTLTNCTISGNTSQDEGGGIYSHTELMPNGNPEPVTLNNTIVAGNSATTSHNDIYGYLQSTSEYNLIGDGSGVSPIASSNLIGTTANPLNPMLGPLVNNGGPTQTMALLPGSPAIDAGSNALAVDASGNPLTTDQRGVGFPRVANGTVDIGAYEFSLSQTISFGSLKGQTYGVAPITLTATDTSGLPVSYSVISGPATLAGSVLTVTGAGSIEVEAAQAGHAYYLAATPVDESFTVTPATLTITANPVTKVYGATLPTLTASYTGFVNGDTVASLTTQPVLTSSATASSPVLSAGYNISVSGASDSNYNISYIDNTLTLTQAPLAITANNAVKLYGAALPTLTASYTGFVNGDTVARLTTLPTLTTTATASSRVNANGYVITASGAIDPNYTITYQIGQLIVNPTPLIIAANNATILYGAPVPTLSTSYYGFVNGDTVASLTTAPTLITTATASSHVFTGGYPITASGASDQDYTITYVPGTLTITAAPLTITANKAAKMYGTALQVLTASYSGLVNGDTSASLASPPTVSTTASSASHVGSYAINASGASDPDYTIIYVPGTLTVIPASLMITAGGKMKVYGAGLPTMTASYSGWVNSDSPGSLTAPPTLSTTATAASHSGSYTITASGATSSDYAISYVGGTLTVTPAPLAITADSKTKVYGSGMPALTASYSGWVNGDQPGSLTTQAALSTTAIASSNVGSYAINATGAASSDYTISYVGGTLSVTPAPLTITANNASKVYGAVIPTLTAHYDGFVNGDTTGSLTTPPVLTTTATASSNVLSGGYDIAVSGASDSDYTFSYVDGTLTVSPASLIVNATNKSMIYGGTVPALPYTYTGLVNGDTSVVFSGSLVTTATSSSSVGDYPITVGTLAATGNYTVGTYNPSTLTIAKADMTVTPYHVTYDGNVHNATGTTLTGLVINSAHTNAGIYTDSWAYTDPNGNYNSSAGIITDTIAKATASINVTPYSAT